MTEFNKVLCYKEAAKYQALAKAEGLPLSHFYAKMIRLGLEVYNDDAADLKGRLSEGGLT